MPRTERPLDPNAGPLAEFAFELRQLRYRAGNPPYRQLARRALRSATALSAAAGGKTFPSLEVTLAYVRACGGDEDAWRARWIELNSTLSSARAAGSDRSPFPLGRLPAGIEPLADADPRLVGPFRLSGRLGAGAMGRVYLGHTPGRRPVAVKVIRPELADDPLFRRRFRREVEAASRVHGLYVAPLVDADPDAAVPWLATAYISGPSLRKAVTDHGPLPQESVLQLGAGIAEALQAIHAAGVIHRDLKPANVLLADDGPRVIDFGIAHAIGTSGLTHAGARVGTPGFISPEQVIGDPVGPTADVFALGAVLVYAATGHLPFGEGATDTVLYRLVHLRADLEHVPEELREIVEDCLAKDPARRPEPAAVVRRCQAGVDESLPGVPWLPRAVAADIDRRTAATRAAPRRSLRASPAVLAVIVFVALAAGVIIGSRHEPAGSLRMERGAVPSVVHLSGPGVTDWVHWGYLDGDTGWPERFAGNPVTADCRYNLHCSNRKRGVNQIRDYTTIGNADPYRLHDRDSAVSFSWDDGEPAPVADGVRSLEYVGLRGNGFRLVVPADRTERTFTVYAGVYQGTLRYVAKLSDDSAAAVTDTSFTAVGSFDESHTSTFAVTYNAGGDGQTLAVELTLAEDLGGGNVALHAATLRAR